jgi:Ser/Thr protein kinase RdoA (MazF antagonist)
MTGEQSDTILHQYARLALRDFGVTPSRLTHLASRHNDVFRVDTSSGERFVLRIQNHLMTDAQARSQVEWLETLVKESDVVVPAPRRTAAGRAFTYVKADDGDRRAVLLRWIPGRPAHTRGDAVYRAGARMIARLHKHAETFRQPSGFSCRRLDGDWLFGSRFFVRGASAKQHLKASERKISAIAERFVRDAMDNLGHTKRRFGVIHSDLNLDNIIFHRGRPSPIDFDEFGKGWYVCDLAELIRTSISPDNWRQRKKLAISGYTEERALDDAELEAFNASIVATFVQYLNWAFIHARNNDDLRWVGFCIQVISRITGR